ncbi:MAG: site-specific DNA-methyltransferase [Cyanobacteria bacterium K_DeepCast_35m_m2_023]|nr:site-specific DNA-methyltransferase [Cyanobacteria bacterium K_DeepCast_35m_m2_023]
MAQRIELWPLSRLKPYERNARTHSTEQIAQIAASIVEFGFTNPLLVDSSDGIIAGHGRLQAAQELGLSTVPVVVLDHLSDRQRRAYILADNQLALNAGWDLELLRTELQDLVADDFDLSVIGFSDEELSDLLPEIEELAPEEQGDPDEIPEPPAEPITKPGDIWLLGKHRLMCGDSTDALAVKRLMAKEKADMVFTDPPYGMNLDTDYTKMGSNRSYDSVISDNSKYDAGFLLAAFDYCSEIFLWGADYYVESLKRTYPNLGSWIIWDKYSDKDRQGLLDGKFGSAFETCWSKTQHKRELARVLVTTNYTARGDETRVHPTQKPVALAEWFFDRWGKQGDIVADLYGGSGSTLIACEKTGRQARLMELDPRYCDVIVQRWQQFTGKLAVLEEPT